MLSKLYIVNFSDSYLLLLISLISSSINYNFFNLRDKGKPFIYRNSVILASLVYTRYNSLYYREVERIIINMFI
jgi:hypothetical protein